jgi:hypothetical protein
MAATPVPPNIPPQPPQPPYFPPPPPPPRSNNALAWILGIIGGGILLLLIAAALIVLLVVKTVHVNQSGDNVEVETPMGSVRANKGGAHATGLLVYPGATALRSEGVNLEASSKWGAAGVAVEKYHTADLRDTVQSWYAKHLGSNYKLQTEESNGHNRIDGLNDEVGKDEVAFVDDTGKGAKVISLAKRDDGTDITLLRVGKRETE